MLIAPAAELQAARLRTLGPIAPLSLETLEQLPELGPAERPGARRRLPPRAVRALLELDAFFTDADDAYGLAFALGCWSPG